MVVVVWAAGGVCLAVLGPATAADATRLNNRFFSPASKAERRVKAEQFFPWGRPQQCGAARICSCCC